MAPSFDEIQIPTKYVRSLCWSGGVLFDWVHGGKRYYLDGSTAESHVGYSYRFDAATMAPSGDYAFLYERLGTKGLLLDARTGSILREVNRSFYHAHVYEYPVALFDLPDGRQVMAHCPEEYNELHIDLLPGGERLTAHGRREESADFFHSRLAVNRGRTRLLSAGWVWHPVDCVAVFGLADALADPATLDAEAAGPPVHADIASAAFLADDVLAVSSAKAATSFADDDEGGVLRPGMMGVFDLTAGEYLSLAECGDEIGTMMPVGRHHVVGFYDHPKLIEVSTGAVVHAWPELKTGKQGSSIIWHGESIPPLAMDSDNHRFAVGSQSEEKITVVQFRGVC